MSRPISWDPSSLLYYVRQSSVNGCWSKSDALMVQTGITPVKPILTKDLSGNVFCEGGSFNLYSSAASNNQWYINDTLFLGQIASTLNYNNSGEFKVKLTEKICSVFSDSLLITKLPRPVTSEISGATWAVKGDTASFSVIPGMVGSVFTWSPVGATVQTGAGTSSVQVKYGIGTTATIGVQEIASNNCRGVQKLLNVNLVNTGVIKVNPENAIRVFPNPVSQFIKVQIETNKAEDVEVVIYNMLGQNMNKEQYVSTLGTMVKDINVQALPAGLYIIKVKMGDKIFTRNFVKE